MRGAFIFRRKSSSVGLGVAVRGRGTQDVTAEEQRGAGRRPSRSREHPRVGSVGTAVSCLCWVRVINNEVYYDC